jgi:broad specificity phosphatase PhoE
VTRLFLVRHGQAAAGWGDEHDPGLDDTGRAQAAAVASALAAFGPLPVVTSPLRRTRETAAAFERTWGVVASVDPAVGEIPSPTDDLQARQSWLAGVLAERWDGLAEGLRTWRDAVADALRAIDVDAVVVTHYVAINAAVGAATGDDRVVCFHPDNCSVTVVEHAGSGSAIRVVELGTVRGTAVL